MSESREHKRRYNLRLQYIAEFCKWQDREPPMRRDGDERAFLLPLR